jgi:hypothetical protein
MLLYYPKSEEQIAARLLDKYSDIKIFLQNHGLTLTYPLHVVIDDKLDEARVDVTMVPHREVRIPLRAPGVLEDGYLQTDPWIYFFFKGLCLQGVYSERSGLPGAAHKVFGDAVSPNRVFPAWIKEGICQLLYVIYTGNQIQDPYQTALFQHTEFPEIDDVSHRPEQWPGKNSYYIFGIPFMQWIYERYGWQRILEFVRLHGKGLVPFEIDLKARETFGQSYSELWDSYKQEHARPKSSGHGYNIAGYWPQPFVYWNFKGIYPGVERIRSRGRYGYVRKNNSVRLSEYESDGRARLHEYRNTTPLVFGADHIWDPGPGDVAVSRRGHRSGLILLPENQNLWLKQIYRPKKTEAVFIPAPPGVLGMSGPVKANDGRIAVAANLRGNWDIWVYDGQWQRITSEPSIEMDPWWNAHRLVFASNITGRFQIHAADRRPVSDCSTVAVLPRQNTYLCLSSGGWQPRRFNVNQLSEPLQTADNHDFEGDSQKAENLESRPYTPFKSIWPNYFRPDGFAGSDDLQLGIKTAGRDVSKRYRMDAGARYSFKHNYISVILGARAKDIALRFTRYPISYNPKQEEEIEESRHEGRFSWQPFGIEEIEISANGQWYDPLDGSGDSGDLFWGALGYRKSLGRHKGWVNLDVFSRGSQSLFGGFNLVFGEKILSSIHFLGGKTWGDTDQGRNTYRIGGNLTEGSFTQRPTRLFPLRGFSSNLLEDRGAFTTGLEFYWPLFNLQKGYKTLPVFLHRMRLGTFIDAGAAGDPIDLDDTLVGAGFELITSLEIGWRRTSSFRIGLGWPVVQPDFLDETGPVFLLQLGNPL